jgi:hypothetical protein
MSSTASKRARFWALAACAVLAGLVLAADAPAQKDKKREGQGVSNSQLAICIAVLRDTKQAMQNAGHNYGGHKAAAVKAMTQAQNQLKLALKFEKKGGKGKSTARKVAAEELTFVSLQPGGKAGKGGKGGDTTPQLRKAIKELKNTNNVLKHANHDYGGHRAQAVKSINGAINQLQQAIKFAKGKSNKKQ